MWLSGKNLLLGRSNWNRSTFLRKAKYWFPGFLMKKQSTFKILFCLLALNYLDRVLIFDGNLKSVSLEGWEKKLWMLKSLMARTDTLINEGSGTTDLVALIWTDSFWKRVPNYGETFWGGIFQLQISVKNSAILNRAGQGRFETVFRKVL